MKKTSFILLIIAIFVASCGDKKTAPVGNDTDSVAQENAYLTKFIGELALSIDSITGTEGYIFDGVNRDGMPRSDRERVISNLSTVKEMLKRQQNRISELEKQLDAADSENAQKIKIIIASMNKQIEEKNKMIAQLNIELSKKDADIMKLQTQVTGLNTNVKNLTEQNQQQEQTISAQDEMLNEGYYIVASKKKLQEMGLLTGGFLKKKKLDVTSIDVSKFNKVDIRNISTISIPAKKAQVLTQHPATSYSITNNGGNVSTLNIKDKASFWSLSTVLVVKY